MPPMSQSHLAHERMLQTPEVRRQVKKGTIGNQTKARYSQQHASYLGGGHPGGAAATPNIRQRAGPESQMALVPVPYSEVHRPLDALTQYAQQPISQQQQILQKLMQVQQKARDYENELMMIKSVDQIEIDHSEALKIKRGDLAIIPGEVYRCNPAHFQL